MFVEMFVVGAQLFGGIRFSICFQLPRSVKRGGEPVFRFLGILSLFPMPRGIDLRPELPSGSFPRRVLVIQVGQHQCLIPTPDKPTPVMCFVLISVDALPFRIR